MICDNWDGLCLVCSAVGSGGTSGMITDDSETFRWDNLESEIAGGARAAPERGGISKSGSNK